SRLLLRTLRYFWPSDLAVAAGVAVGTAVLAGSLLVGASVRGSLVDLAERRLGGVDHVMVTPHLFTARLSASLEGQPDFARDFEGAESLLALPGSASVPATGARAGSVSVLGRGSVEEGTCVLSRALARDLRAAEGTVVVLRVDRRGRVPAESPLGAEEDEVAILRLRVARVAGEGGFEDAFGLHATQRAARNVWVSRDELARRIDAEGRANVMLVRAHDGRDGPDAARRLESLCKRAAAVEDYGLKLLAMDAVPRPDASGGGVILESDRIFIDPEVEGALDGLDTGRDIGRASVKVLAYLADTIRDARTRREIPYSMVAGMSAPPGGELAADEIVLNQWASDDLAARVGDSIELVYLVRADGGLLEERRAAFRLVRVVGTEAPGADRSLVPRFKGLTDAERMGTWDAPREMRFDASRVRTVDEDYWDEHRAAPKAFIALPKARELWGTRWGSLTSVRFPRARRADLARELAASLGPGGLVFTSIRSEQMRAAAGSTDFSGLFVGFSMFLVAGAALLVALLMRLSIEQRTRQVGLMLALGFTERGVRRVFMGEGLAVLAVGAAVGAALAVGYAWLMMAGLGTLWRGAVGTGLLSLHVDGTLLCAGTGAGFLVGALAVWRAISGVRTMSPAAALAGKTVGVATAGGVRGGRPRAALVAFGALVMAGVALPLAAAATDAVPEAPAFFGSGVCILAAALVGFRAWLLRAGRGARSTLGMPARLGLGRLGVANAARNPSRSMLTVGLLMTAVFVVVAVGAMRGAVPSDAGRASGTGGYALVADFDVAVPYDLSLAEGRRLLGLDTSAGIEWDRVRFAGMRASPGEDASCRNLYRPSKPRVMSAPEAFAEEGRFSFASVLDLPGVEAGASPWRLLGAELPDGAVPAIADVESARWIMHKGLGDSVEVTDEKGRERELRIVALLGKGIFQAEVLVSERDFVSLFPSRSGYGRFLVDAPSTDAKRDAPEDAPKDEAERVAALLRERLARFGPEVEPADERLGSFMRIANSYISAFQLLGGLGVLLGSLGLVVVLARGVVERRREIALMSAIGFRRRSVAWTLVAENAFLLAAGIAMGVAAAAVAVAPTFVRRGPGMTPLLLTTGLVAATGVLVVILTTWTAVALVRRVSPGLLRQE
ncbi:MAG: FtsX-like permease family protein, partial [Planctomycetota bacterium]